MFLKKKKVLIIAPVGKHGGRELETGFIASVLSNDFEVKVISTGNYYVNSEVFNFGEINYTSLNKEVFKKYFVFRFVVLIASLLKKRISYNHTSLSLTSIKKILQIEKYKINYLNKEIIKNDLIFICAQLTSNYLEEIINTADINKIPILFRTTGTINKDMPKFNWLEKVSLFIHHSQKNAKQLNNLGKLNYVIIDQCAFLEDKLLQINIKPKLITNFFVLSRLSKEKKIDIVINTFNQMNSKSDFLYIFGDGPEKKYLKTLALNNLNIVFRGHIQNYDIPIVYKENDCLIISSSEEAGPLTGIEAMASGKIIISTKVGAMTERLTNYNFWYDGTQIELEKLIKKVKLLRNNDVAIISKQMRKQYNLNYSKAKVSKKYLSNVSRFVKDRV